MRFPLEIIQNIYNFLDIDTKLIFHKIYDHKTFRFQKIILYNKNIDVILKTKIFKIQLRNTLFQRLGIF